MVWYRVKTTKVSHIHDVGLNWPWASEGKFTLLFFWYC